MAEIRNCKVLVVGAGPGGYVAAIRAGQLGLDTVIVEGSKAGGTCLIRGCIPSKAIIHAASSFEEIEKHSGKGKMGISISGKPKVNMKEMVAWKETIVTKLNKGVEGLLKAAKVSQFQRCELNPFLQLAIIYCLLRQYTLLMPHLQVLLILQIHYPILLFHRRPFFQHSLFEQLELQ